MKAKSIHGGSVDEIKNAVTKCMEDSFKPNLAIMFVSVQQDRHAITEIFNALDIDLFGATSCGEFVNGIQSEGGVAGLLLELSPDSYKIILGDIGENSMETTVKEISDAALQKFKNPSLIVCSTGIIENRTMFDGESFVSELEKGLGPDKIFVGGMAGDDWKLIATYVFTNHRETENGIIALALNADVISLKGMAITGWKPMGISRTVTKNKGNLLFEIDGKSAVDMYLKYLGKEDKINDSSFNVFEELSFEFPLIVERDNDETVLRSPMKIDYVEKALVMDYEMAEGSKFWFTMPPDFDIVEEILDKANSIKNNQESEADALLIFSCAGREPSLGPFVTQENDGLAKLWNAPMAGFFTYGEYGRALNGKQNLHSGACCWVALKENHA